MTFLDAVEAKVGAGQRLYRVNAVGKNPVHPYAVFSVSGDRADTRTLDAAHGVRFYRITWQAFGKTLESATSTDDAITDALLDQTLEVDGYECGPCSDAQTVLGALTRDPDDQGVIQITSSLLFIATPLEA